MKLLLNTNTWNVHLPTCEYLIGWLDAEPDREASIEEIEADRARLRELAREGYTACSHCQPPLGW